MSVIAKVFGSEGLSNRVALYVPSTTAVDQPLDESTAEQFVSRSLRLMSELFGGATALPASGGWVASDGKLVTERVTIVYSFTGDLTTEDLMKIKFFVESLKAEMRQEAIAVEINGRLIFV